MKKLLSILIIWISTAVYASGQENVKFIQDLDFLYLHLKECVSYQTQRRSQKLLYHKYIEIRKTAELRNLSVLNQYILLYDLMDVVNDQNNTIQLNEGMFSYANLTLKDTPNSVSTQDKFFSFPILHLSADSLMRELRSKPLQSVEGIYPYNDSIEIGVFLYEPNKYLGIILNSKDPSWHSLEPVFYIVHKDSNSYRIVGKNFNNKGIYSNLSKIYNGVIKSLNLHKKNSICTISTPEFHQNFIFTTLNNHMSYLKLGSFNYSTSELKIIQSFQILFEDSLYTPNLIVDVRNNDGGYNQISKSFYKYLKKYSGNLFILMNYHTAHEAERFILKLNYRKNVTLLGDTTRGAFSYAQSNPSLQTSPSGVFKIALTNYKKGWRKYLYYENVGIAPSISLSNCENWIKQTQDIIDNYVRK